MLLLKTVGRQRPGRLSSLVVPVPNCTRRLLSTSPQAGKTDVVKTAKSLTKEEKSKNNSDLRWRMLSFATPAKREIAFGILFLPGALVATMAFPIIIGKVIDLVSETLNKNNGILSDGTLNQVYLYGAGLVGLGLCGAAATAGRNYYMNLATEIITRDLRLRLFSHLIKKKPIQYFDTAKTGDLTNRLSADTTVISHVLTESVSMGLRGVGTLVFGVGFLFYTSSQLALVSLTALLPLVVTARYFGSFIRSKTNEQLEKFGESTSVAEESFHAVRVVHMFNREALQIGKYHSKLNDVFDIGKKITLYRAGFMGSTELIVDLSLLSVIGYGSYLVFSQVITPGELTTFLMYSLYVAGANFQITSVYTQAMKAMGATERILEVWPANALDVETPADTASALKKKELTQNFFDSSKTISADFINVSFSYPTRPDQKILSNFSLNIPAGKSVALVGRSGSGKSTIISLLSRLYDLKDTTHGEIKLGSATSGELKLEDADLSVLRDNIGVVTQEPIIFMSSVYDNILFGKLEATREEVISAAKLANIHSFIESLPNGYDTLVGERGSQLSGGQKQRLCIARAVLKDPKILILDEATSSLDVENEQLVQSAFEKLMPGRTSIIIAHRLSTIRSADYIAVLDGGSVVQFGDRQKIFADKAGRFQEFLAKNQVF